MPRERRSSPQKWARFRPMNSLLLCDDTYAAKEIDFDGSGLGLYIGAGEAGKSVAAGRVRVPRHLVGRQDARFFAREQMLAGKLLGQDGGPW